MDTQIKNFLDRIHKETISKRTYYTFGFQEAYKKCENEDLGYINFFNQIKFEEIDRIIPLTNPNNRCGKLRESTEYITIHDTASGAPTAGCLSHDKWLWSMATDPNSTHSVSWHYIVDESSIYKHLPTDEVGYHAGDGTRVKLEFIDTLIKANNKNSITIDDGYYVINGIKSSILAPVNNEGNKLDNSNIPTLGINYKIGENGNIYLSNTYYNSTYNMIGNRGGNLNSIGIESCVNYGSDYIKTMRVLAYLVSNLLIKYDLPISRVLQHNSFSGKNCPMTMRFNGLWDEFIELVDIYLTYNKLFKKYDIKFVPIDTDFISNEGKIIKYEKNKEISYKVIVNNEEIIYKTILE